MEVTWAEVVALRERVRQIEVVQENTDDHDYEYDGVVDRD